MRMKRLIILLLFFLPTLIHAQMVTMNFKDMDIKVLIDTVAEVTNKTFVVDPRVKGKVTVVSAKPMDRDQVYDVFLSILSVHGFAAVPSGKIIKIVPQSQAKAENMPVVPPNKLPRGSELVTQIIAIKNVAAAQLVPLLRPLIPQQGHLVAYPSNNTLVISDYADNVSRLRKIIKRIDRPNTEDVEVVVLQHASAAEVAQTLTNLEQKNRATAGVEQLIATNIVADDRTNSLLISGDRETRLRLRALVTHLDTPLKTVGNTEVIYLRYAEASDLVDVLKGVSESMVMQQKAEGQDNNAQVYKTSIQADDSTNSLVVTAAPEVLRNLRTVIRQLDVRRAQVLVEAVIAEVSIDTARELGVQWAIFDRSASTAPVGVSNFNNTQPGILDLAASAYQADQGGTLNLPDGINGSLLGIGRFKSTGINFAVLLKALSSDTNSNVLSTPSLLTLDNQEAEIIVGQNVPFVTGQYTNTGATTGATNPFQTIQREDVGLKLKVTPQINEGNAIKLDIEQEVSSLTRSSVATSDVVTNKRQIKTSVIVEDGNMIVLGGLIDEDLQQTLQKVPLLGDLPLIGALFRSQSTQKIKRNLMIFLHPVIVRDAAMETLVSSGKYSYIRKKQLEQKAKGLPLMDDEEVPVLPTLDDFLTILPEIDETPDLNDDNEMAALASEPALEDKVIDEVVEAEIIEEENITP